jgi:hypothetical protein
LEKIPNLIENGYLLHQDNAPAHTSNIALETFRKLNIEILSHPHYSSDLAKYDFWLFPNLKNRIKGRKFESRKEVMDTVIGYNNMVSKNYLEFVYRSWTGRWDKCVKLREVTSKMSTSIWMISASVDFISN